jgi:tRNA G46 methylase TrmB
MIHEILTECWDDWEEDRYPKDRRMKIIHETIGTPDMSVENTRFLINEIMRRVGGVYLEVGVWVGHSLMSAAVHNPHVECVGIENFASHPDMKRLEYNLKHHIPSNAVVLNGSYVDIIPRMTEYIDDVDVYYYDGHHSHEATLLGLYMALPLMKKKSYILLDDGTTT